MRPALLVLGGAAVLLLSAWGIFYYALASLSFAGDDATVGERLRERFAAASSPVNESREFVFNEPLEGIEAVGPWILTITPSADDKTRVRLFAHGKADSRRARVTVTDENGVKALLMKVTTLPPREVFYRLRDGDGNMKFFGDYYRAEVQIPALRYIYLPFYYASSRHSPIVVNFSGFTGQNLSVGAFAISDVLIRGEKSSFKDLMIGVSTSAGNETGAWGAMQFNDVAADNVILDVSGAWRAQLNIKGGNLSGEVKHGAQVRYRGAAATNSVKVENAVFEQTR